MLSVTLDGSRTFGQSQSVNKRRWNRVVPSKCRFRFYKPTDLFPASSVADVKNV